MGTRADGSTPVPSCAVCDGATAHPEGFVTAPNGAVFGYSCVRRLADAAPAESRQLLQLPLRPHTPERAPSLALAGPPPETETNTSPSAAAAVVAPPVQPLAPPGPPLPWEILDSLRLDVVGQDEAAYGLAVAAHQHYRRLAMIARGSPVELSKANVLMIGPSGSGKTELARSLAKTLNVPLAIVDMAGVTGAGYVGADVERCLVELLRVADGDIARAQRGIVFLDEIDKKARRFRSGGMRDIGGDDVQSQLLGLLEGTRVDLPGEAAADSPRVLSTHQVLFIASGAFEGLAEIIAERKKRERPSSMGFATGGADVTRLSESELLAQVCPDDLIQYGLKRELVGRLPHVIHTRPLSVEALVRVLREPRNALTKQYEAAARVDNVDLFFTPRALEAIAREAWSQGTGARGLQAILVRVVGPYLFAAPATQGKPHLVVVTPEHVYRPARPWEGEKPQLVPWPDPASIRRR